MCRTAASCLCPRRSHDTSLLWLSEKLSLRHSQSKCSRWISVGSQRTCQIPTCRRPSFDLSMDPPCGARDLATFGTALEQHRHVGPNRVQVQHRGGVPNYPSNGIRFWWYLHLALELKFIFECPDHATHQSHCSLGQSILSMTTERNCDLGGFGSCPSCISYCCGDLHHCWFSIASCGHLCRAQRVHPLCPASRLRPFLSTVSAKTIPVRRYFATNIGVASPLR